jgi:hypothetical protein
MSYSSQRPTRRKPQVEPAPGDLPPPPPETRPISRDRSSPLRDPFAPPETRPIATPTVGSVDRRRKERRARKAAIAAPAAIPRDQPRQIFISWRWFSGGIVVIMGIMLYILMTNDAFFVNSIAVGYNGETRYLTPPEIFERSGLAKIHLFWIDAAEVEKQLELDPQIASADVTIGWPPNLVQITITERQPAIIWEQAGQRVWVDVRGRVMALRADLPSLVRVIVEKPAKDIHLSRCELQGTDRVLGPGACIDQDTVNGVLQFKALYPDVGEMVYDPVKGLGFHDGRKWVLWIGKGTDIQTKMVVYNAIVADALAKERQPIEISVIDPDRPYYSWADK